MGVTTKEDESASSTLVAAGAPPPPPEVYKESSTETILRSEYRFSMLTSFEGHYYMWEIPSSTWLLLMENGTGECYVGALERMNPPFKHYVHLFGRGHRLSCTDGDAAINRAERELVRRNPKSPTLLRILCEVHKVNGARKQVLKVEREQVDFLIHVALSLGMGATMRLLRRSLREAIQNKFH